MSNMHDPTYLLPVDDEATFIAVDDDLLDIRLVPNAPLLNIYEVDAGGLYPEVPWTDSEYGAQYRAYSSKQLVAAQSRGEARAQFIRYWNGEESGAYAELEWTDKISIHIVQKNVAVIPDGVISNWVSHPLIPDDDPAVFVFADGDMLAPQLVADADDRDSAQDAV